MLQVIGKEYDFEITIKGRIKLDPMDNWAMTRIAQEVCSLSEKHTDSTGQKIIFANPSSIQITEIEQ